MYAYARTILVACCLQCSLGADQAAGNDLPFDKAKALAALKTTKDALYLQRTAIKLIETNDSAVLNQVANFLCDPDFLARLEPAGDLESQGRQRIQQVLNAVGKLGTPEAEAILLKLVEDKTYADDGSMLRRVVSATPYIKQPSEKLIAFLNGQAEAYDGKILSTVVRIFLYMAQPATLAEAEKRFLSPDVHYGAKRSWVNFMLYYRHNLAILQLWERLLKSDKVDAELRDRLVLRLFEFQKEWYGPHLTSPLALPPDRKDAPTDVLQELRKLADLSLKLDIPAETKAIVEKARKEIDDILAKRGRK